MHEGDIAREIYRELWAGQFLISILINELVGNLSTVFNVGFTFGEEELGNFIELSIAHDIAELRKAQGRVTTTIDEGHGEDLSSCLLT